MLRGPPDRASRGRFGRVKHVASRVKHLARSPPSGLRGAGRRDRPSWGSKRTLFLYRCNPSKELTRELRKRVVARAHDHDAVAATSQADQQIAAAGAIRKGKRLSTTARDFSN